jgi:hypothetical protein
MALSVIGAGFPRTGTASLKIGLETLGFAPCYHMSEVFGRPDHWQMWIDAGEGNPVDWDLLFAGYRATADAPGCHFYRELAAHYPEAKVVLTTRDPDGWFRSTQNTILSEPLNVARRDRPPLQMRMLTALGWNGEIPETHDRETMVARMTAHNEAVIRTVPPERLLVWQPAQGWEPLCAFLGVAVPDTPYPHINTTDAFQKMVAEGDGSRPEGIKQNFREQAAQQGVTKP